MAADNRHLYELFDGTDVVGYVYVSELGYNFHVFPICQSMLKQKYEKIIVPVSYRVLPTDSRSDRLIRTVLDVSRKSKRQIKLILENFGCQPSTK